MYLGPDYRQPLLFAGVTFSKSPENTKTADNKGTLYGQKVSFLKTKWAKICG